MRTTGEHALLLLREGEYGCGENCGEEIDPRRLGGKPESLHCIRCQQLIEMAG
ncbi:hypothetical protein [Porticoccus sp.]